MKSCTPQLTLLVSLLSAAIPSHANSDAFADFYVPYNQIQSDYTCLNRQTMQAVFGIPLASALKGENRPVESVSWDDAQDFIKTINSNLPHLEFGLPNKSQWEYACRAGTITPFSFGKNITPNQVNYRGTAPYHDGEKGEYREETVPVKSLPANPWGLYEMHGNVWEWCQDNWQEDLGTHPRTDPRNESVEADGFTENHKAPSTYF